MANRSLSTRRRLRALRKQGKPPAGIEPASHSGSGKEGDPRAALRHFPRCHLFTFRYYQYKTYTQAFFEKSLSDMAHQKVLPPHLPE